MSTTVHSATDVRPFNVDVPEEKLDELRRRINATQWPPDELVDDPSQGVQSATMQALMRYWVNEYDWRRCEAELNALPQFKTKIDGLDIHFIHVKSPHENALPLIITHGWPGSVIEMLGGRRSAHGPDGAMADAPRTRSTSCCRRCPASASPNSRPSSAGIRTAPRRPGRS